MRNPFRDDRWITTRSALSPEQVHALGVVTLSFNTAETGLFYLFCNVSRLSGQLARILVHDLQGPAICERIVEICSNDGLTDMPTKEAVKHATILFDKNRINRNQLTHFMVTASTDGVELWRNKGPRIERDIVPSELEDIRRVADDIRRMNGYLVELGNWMANFNRRSPLDEGELPPLPDKPALPERLWKPQDRPRPDHKTR